MTDLTIRQFLISRYGEKSFSVAEQNPSRETNFRQELIGCKNISANNPIINILGYEAERISAQAINQALRTVDTIIAKAKQQLYGKSPAEAMEQLETIIAQYIKDSAEVNTLTEAIIAGKLDCDTKSFIILAAGSELGWNISLVHRSGAQGHMFIQDNSTQKVYDPSKKSWPAQVNLKDTTVLSSPETIRALVYENIANSLHRLGKTTEAQNYYLRALNDNPEAFGALLNLGVIAQEKGGREDLILARDIASQAIRLRPTAYEAYANYGAAQYGLSNFIEARTSYLKAQQLQPRNPQVALALGAIAEKTGDRTLAKNYYQQAQNNGYFFNIKGHTYAVLNDKTTLTPLVAPKAIQASTALLIGSLGASPITGTVISQNYTSRYTLTFSGSEGFCLAGTGYSANALDQTANDAVGVYDYPDVNTGSRYWVDNQVSDAGSFSSAQLDTDTASPFTMSRGASGPNYLGGTLVNTFSKSTTDQEYYIRYYNGVSLQFKAILALAPRNFTNSGSISVSQSGSTYTLNCSGLTTFSGTSSAHQSRKYYIGYTNASGDFVVAQELVGYPNSTITANVFTSPATGNWEMRYLDTEQDSEGTSYNVLSAAINISSVMDTYKATLLTPARQVNGSMQLSGYNSGTSKYTYTYTGGAGSIAPQTPAAGVERKWYVRYGAGLAQREDVTSQISTILAGTAFSITDDPNPYTNSNIELYFVDYAKTPDGTQWLQQDGTATGTSTNYTSEPIKSTSVKPNNVSVPTGNLTSGVISYASNYNATDGWQYSLTFTAPGAKKAGITSRSFIATWGSSPVQTKDLGDLTSGDKFYITCDPTDSTANLTIHYTETYEDGTAVTFSTTGTQSSQTVTFGSIAPPSGDIAGTFNIASRDTSGDYHYSITGLDPWPVSAPLEAKFYAVWKNSSGVDTPIELTGFDPSDFTITGSENPYLLNAATNNIRIYYSLTNTFTSAVVVAKSDELSLTTDSTVRTFTGNLTTTGITDGKYVYVFTHNPITPAAPGNGMVRVFTLEYRDKSGTLKRVQYNDIPTETQLNNLLEDISPFEAKPSIYYRDYYDYTIPTGETFPSHTDSHNAYIESPHIDFDGSAHSADAAFYKIDPERGKNPFVNNMRLNATRPIESGKINWPVKTLTIYTTRDRCPLITDTDGTDLTENLSAVGTEVIDGVKYNKYQVSFANETTFIDLKKLYTHNMGQGILDITYVNNQTQRVNLMNTDNAHVQEMLNKPWGPEEPHSTPAEPLVLRETLTKTSSTDIVGESLFFRINETERPLRFAVNLSGAFKAIPPVSIIISAPSSVQSIIDQINSSSIVSFEEANVGYAKLNAFFPDFIETIMIAGTTPNQYNFKYIAPQDFDKKISELQKTLDQRAKDEPAKYTPEVVSAIKKFLQQLTELSKNKAPYISKPEQLGELLGYQDTKLDTVVIQPDIQAFGNEFGTGAKAKVPFDLFFAQPEGSFIKEWGVAGEGDLALYQPGLFGRLELFPYMFMNLGDAGTLKTTLGMELYNESIGNDSGVYMNYGLDVSWDPTKYFNVGLRYWNDSFVRAKHGAFNITEPFAGKDADHYLKLDVNATLPWQVSDQAALNFLVGVSPSMDWHPGHGLAFTLGNYQLGADFTLAGATEWMPNFNIGAKTENVASFFIGQTIDNSLYLSEKAKLDAYLNVTFGGNFSINTTYTLQKLGSQLTHSGTAGADWEFVPGFTLGGTGTLTATAGVTTPPVWSAGLYLKISPEKVGQKPRRPESTEDTRSQNSTPAQDILFE